MSLYGTPLYSEGDNNTGFFLKRLVESMPPAYRPPETRDFLERFLAPSAEDLAGVNQIIDLLDTYVLPESMPEQWLDWILTEWMGWTLIPDGYPVARKRRLLANLHAHYKRRYTVGRNTTKSYDTIEQQLADPAAGEGIRLLLREFGIVADVYDRPLYWGSYYGEWGVSPQLNVLIRVHYYEPWESPQHTYFGDYYGFTYFYRTTPVITNAFVAALCEWSRPAAVQMVIHFITQSTELRLDANLYDQSILLPINEQISDEANITEP